MNRRHFIKTTAVVGVAMPFISLAKPPVYKTPDSVFTFDEIDEFCNEWGWIHIKEFVPAGWEGHKPPYYWSTYGQGKFIGVDGKDYMTFGTYRTQWIGPVKTDAKDKAEFRKFLKVIAGDYYWKGKREHYYFYDVLLTGGDPYNCRWMKEYKPDFEPRKEDLKYHGQPHWKVVLYHMGVTDGKMWGYLKDREKTL